MTKKRCAWVKLSDETYVKYHDEEWGKPLHDDRALFELFSLETQSAGLSWLTILKKRENYRKAFKNFELSFVSNLTCKDIDEIMLQKVIKNRAKIASIINNAKLFEEIIKEFGSIDNFFWSYVDNTPIVNHIEDSKTAHTSSPISDSLTKALKKRGFKFVGTITIYAFMQACGMVNDHKMDCWCKNI
jgi:DNA-3-methyladenine glycosylase I